MNLFWCAQTSLDLVVDFWDMYVLCYDENLMK